MGRILAVSQTRRGILAGACGLAAVGVQASAGTEGFSFGLTPVFLNSDVELLARLRAFLERRLAAPVRLVKRRTYQEITSLLVSGQLDAAWICGFPFVANHAKLDLVAVPLWQGQPLYRSYLICAAGREAASLDDLAGDVHAFSDPDSNSGWLVTAAELARRNATPDRFFGGSIFTYGHRNVVRAVAAGLAASGSVDGYVYEVLRETEPALVDATRVVRASEPLGFPPVACGRAAAAGARMARFREALLGMAHDADGKAALDVLRLGGFSPEDAGLYDPIAAKVDLVRGVAG